MSGNVWEWCSDRYDAGYYNSSLKRDPKGDKYGLCRVLRGGSWSDYDYYCRTSLRFRSYPQVTNNDNGFRLVMDNK
jgi:formylglycine-generating enzyme